MHTNVNYWKYTNTIRWRKILCWSFCWSQKSFWHSNHNTILRKLNQYGIRGIANEWFCSYLMKKKTICQYTKYVLSQRNFNRSSTGIRSWPTPLPHLYKWPAQKWWILKNIPTTLLMTQALYKTSKQRSNLSY